MATITRHALRVYSALSALKGPDGDVLDSLIPFFEDILRLTHNKIFDPAVFAAGIRKQYSWRFTKEIAEEFIPRLLKLGYLKRVPLGNEAAYVVDFSSPPPQQDSEDIRVLFETVITEFERFSPRVTDLFTYSRSRDELADILIRFLVRSNVFGQDGVYNPTQNEDGQLKDIEEGGRHLDSADEYISARFVRHIADTRKELLPVLSRLSAIGLLTEVVDDFVKPISTAPHADLSIVLDAPLALDYLGLSGTSIHKDTTTIFNALRDIGCRLFVFPVTCEEMSRNLNSMLARQHGRFGPTHDAIVRGEVIIDYVRAVANRPEEALEKVGIQIKPIDTISFPNSHKYFTEQESDDFLSRIGWGSDVAAKDHDRTCLTLLMRLREGKQSSDIFKTKYVFATRNTTFSRVSKDYCVQSRKLNYRQEGPVVHHRELATVAWLRTGLGAAENIPRNSLVATCDRVLRTRPEVTNAIRTKILEYTPDKADQFELLLQDQRSVRRMADLTLNDEHIVTADNAQHLLDSMRQAIAEEVQAKATEEIAEAKKTHAVLQRKARERSAKEHEEKDQSIRRLEEEKANLALQKELNESKLRAQEGHILDTVNGRLRRATVLITALAITLVALAIVQYWFQFLPARYVYFLITPLATVSLLKLCLNFFGKQLPGVAHLQTSMGSYWIRKELRRRGITWISAEDFDIQNGKVMLRQRNN